AQIDAAGDDFVDRAQQVPARLALDDITVDAGVQRLHDVGVLLVHREQDRFGLRVELGDGARRIEPVQSGHRDIEDCDVGLHAPNEGDSFAPVVGLAHDLYTLPALEELLDALNQDQMIVYHY